MALTTASREINSDTPALLVRQAEALSKRVRLVAGSAVALMMAVAIFYIAAQTDPIEPRIPFTIIVALGIILIAVTAWKGWDRRRRDAFFIVVVAQSALLGLFLYSIGRYHPWHAYWMLILVIAGAWLGRKALAAATLLTIVVALSPLAYGGFRTLSGALFSYGVEIPGYIVAALLTHLLFSNLRQSQRQTLDFAREAQHRADQVEESNAKLRALYDSARTMATAADSPAVITMAERGIESLIGQPVHLHHIRLAPPNTDLSPLDGVVDLHLDSLLQAAPAQMESLLGAQESYISDEFVLRELSSITNTNMARAAACFPLQDAADMPEIICVVFQDHLPDQQDRQLLETFLGLLRGTLTGFRLRHEVAEKEAATLAADLKAEFVSVVSHELRTPLSSLQGFSELLLMRDDLPNDAQPSLERINNSSQYMARLVNDLHDLSLLEAGRMELQAQTQSVADIIRPLIDDFAKTTEIHSIGLDIADDLSEIHGDPTRIRQVVSNLVQNAIKYSPDGGEITVAALPHEGQVRIAIRDHGLGIPENEQGRVFSRFVRGEGTARTLKGTGLGLTICKQIVEAHRGDIWVESTPGEGSCFSFTLPAAA